MSARDKRRQEKLKRRKRRKEKKAAEKPRECGDCHECCVHVPVESFNKPAGTPCQHICPAHKSGACSIYQDRPPECAQYQCSWLMGQLPKSLKPDRCGILFETSFITWPKKITMLLGFENEPRKLNTRILKELADFIPRGMVAIINRHDGNGTIPVGREEDVEAVAQWFAAVEEHGEVTQVAADKTITQKLGSI